MKTLAKILSIILVIATLLSFSACVTEEDTQINVGVLTGATGMGAVKAAKDAEATADQPDGYKFSFYNANAPEMANAIKADILSGVLDIAALPINDAAKLYNESEGKIEVIATNALGVLSILGKQSLNSFADLKGKTIYAVAKGSTPEYILRHLITENGLTVVEDEDGGTKDLGENGVRVIFAAPAVVQAKFKLSAADSGVYAMLPEPAATATLKSTEGASIVFDVNDEWDKVSDTKIVQGCLVANKEFADAHPKAIEKFLAAYKASVDFVNAPENLETVSALMVEYGVLLAPQKAFAADAIPRANIVCEVGKTMKKDIKAMLQVLYDIDKNSINGALPDSDFYGSYDIG